MRKTLSLLLLAAVMIFSAALFSVFVSAKEDVVLTSSEVIFIKDDYNSGDGSGRDADNPFRPTHVDDTKKYLNSALYQAAEQFINTGGTIVICGELTIGDDVVYGSSSVNSDCFMPPSAKTLVITSVYDGVDYAATSNAHLLLTGSAHLTMYAPTHWHDLTILTGTSNRAIVCGCMATVFGENITCGNIDGRTDAIYYPSIAGAHRYGTITGSSDVTVMSGTWNTVSGSNFGITGADFGPYVQNGDVEINFTGGTVKTAIYGTCREIIPNVRQNGNVFVNVTGGSVPKIYGTGLNCFSTSNKKVMVSLSGNLASTTVVKPYYSASNTNLETKYADTGDSKYEQFPAEYTVLDVSDTGMTNAKLSSVISSASDFDTIRYPSKWISSTEVLSMPSSDVAFKGDSPSSVGASLRLAFTDPTNGNTYYSVENCAEDGGAFTASCDTSEEKVVRASYFYGSHKYGEKDVTVYFTPKIVLDGIQLKHESSLSNFEIRFVGNLAKDYSSEVTVTDYGVLAIPTYFIDSDSKLNFGQTNGMYEYHSTVSGNVTEVSDQSHVLFFVTKSLKIKPSEFSQSFTATGFVKFTVGGREYVRYSAPIRRSLYDSAKKASAAGSPETDEVKASLSEKVVRTYDTYDTSTVYVTGNTFRNRAVSYMKSQANVEWKPTKSFWIYNTRRTADGKPLGVSVKTFFDASKTYHGIPYTNDHVAQFESFSNLIVDGKYTGDVIANTGGKTEATMTATDKANGLENYLTFPGSDCSTAVITSWNTVLTNRAELRNLTATYWMVPGFGTGTVKVGDYALNGTHYTNTICSDNGRQTMYEAYALLGLGDAIVRWNEQGHTRMVTGTVYVKRNSDGTINGESSYVTTTEEANSLWQNAGRSFADSTWRVDTQYTFAKLFDTDYIPITIPELATGSVPGEFTLVTNLDLETDLAAGRISGNVRSNRQIMGVEFIVKDTSGTVVADRKFYVENEYGIHASDVPLYDFSDEFGLMLETLPSGDYLFSFSAMVSSAPEVKLVVDRPFTK